MEEIKTKAKEKAKRAKKWCSDRYWDARTLWTYHKDEVIGAAGLATSAVLGGVKIYDAITVRQRRKAAMRYEDRRIFYDPSTGMRWRLKRNLSNQQNKELARRKANGESVGDILADMGLLKRR